MSEATSVDSGAYDRDLIVHLRDVVCSPIAREAANRIEELLEALYVQQHETAAFDRIRTARCVMEDTGDERAFLEALDEALEENGLAPEPCPMCSRYGPHSHAID